MRAVVVAIFLFAASARAGVVDDRMASVAALTQRLDALGVERRALAQAYDQKAAAVAELKAQPSAWNRDRKLQALLVESQTMAAALDKKDSEIRSVATSLGNEKRALLTAVEAELAGNPTPERRSVLESQRSQLSAELARRIHIANERIDPNDDADDLELKAGALGQSERALADEGERLRRRVLYFRRQARLTKSRARADEQDVFREEERLPGRAATAATGGRDTAQNPGAETGPAGAPRALDVAADPSIVLADVLAAGTIDELRRAEKSGDPEALARSAEAAEKAVAGRAAAVHQRRLEMLERAKALRGN